jgi:Domain of unknown function (DUF4114)
MNMLKKLTVISFLILIMINSCKKEDNSNHYTSVDKKGTIVVNENQQSLNTRVKKSNQILRVGNADFNAEKSEGIPQQIDLTQNFVFKLRAEVNAPVYDGNTLQATHVRILDHYAFVTYNTQGSKYLGGLDVFDVSDISNPVIIWNAIFKNADISSIDYFNNKLYVVGAFDPDANPPSYLKSPAMLEVLSLSSDRKIAGIDTIIDLNGYVGTDIRVNEQAIYATSGSNGYLKVFDHNYKLLDTLKLDHARAVDANNNNIYVLQGQPGRLNVYSQSGASYETTYQVGDANQAEAQSGIVATSKYLFAALNEGGVQMLNLDGSLKQLVPRPLIPENADPENYVSNSVSVYNDLVLIANGAAGLYVGGIISSRNDSLAIIGKIAFNDGASTNFVVANDSVIFVATGLGGLKILSVSIDEGLPPVIIPTKPCATLYDKIISMFPESTNNMITNPDLFAVTANKRILLTQESEVYITYVSEGAGWKNSFGYYTYDVNNPPTSAEALTKTILFPNVSGVGEGGALNTGDMVQVGTGKFKAGTVVGFYLIAQGWANGLVTDGRYTLYTDQNLNINDHQQHLLFKEKTCGDIVMTFEDIDQDDHLSYQDNDFNDIIFTISDNKNQKVTTSFDMTNLVIK